MTGFLLFSFIIHLKSIFFLFWREPCLHYRPRWLCNTVLQMYVWATQNKLAGHWLEPQV
jgi:hypothetical protein